MSQTIKLKRNKTNAATTPSTLLEGEIAVNILDKSLFVGDGSNVVRLYVGSDKYFNSDGYANNALKLGGNEVSYFGTATQVTAINKSIESINNTKVTGIKMNNGLHMLPVNGVVDLGTILTEHQDLSGLATKTELESKVDKVEGKGLSTEDFTTTLKNKLQGLSNYDDSAINDKIDGIQDQIDTLVSGDAATAIESFNEIIAFLDGVEDTETLEGIIAAIEQQIADKVSTETFNALATRVGTAETAIATNATAIATNKTNIATNTTDITNLKTRADGLQGDIEGLQGDVSDILDDYLSKANGGIIKGAVTIQAALKMNTLYLPNSNNTPSDYTLSVGTLGAGADTPEGGGSGIAQVTINVNGSPYKTDANGVVTLPNYPTTLKNPYALTFGTKTYDGSAAQTITASDLGAMRRMSLNGTDVLLSDKYNAFGTTNKGDVSAQVENPTSYGAYISLAYTPDKNQGYQIYGDTYSNGDMYRRFRKAGDNNTTYSSWVKILDEDNYSNYALPLSGGTLQGDIADLLVINRLSNTSTAYITFKGNNSLRGRIGFNSSNQPVVQDISISGDNQLLIHSGNIGNQSVANANNLSYASRLTGASAVDAFIEKGKVKVAAFEGYGAIGFGSNDGIVMSIPWDSDATYGAQLAFDELNTAPKMAMRSKTGTWSSWKTIAFTDSNVASATKLQTARTIWGQSFDGSANVSGVLSDVNQVTFDANKTYGIFRGDWYSNVLTRDDLGFYAPRSVFSGNVLIGDSTDTSAKLGVVGGRVLITDSNRQSLNSTCIVDSALLHLSSIGSYNDGLFFGHMSNATSWIQSAYYGTSAYPSANGTYSLALNPLGGNVGIGTTEPQYKLDVNGQTRIVSSPFAGLVIHRQGSASTMGSAISLSTDYAQLGVIGWNQYNEFKLQDGEGNKFFYGGKDGVTIDAILYAPQGATAKGYLYINDYVDNNTYKFTFLQNEGIARMYNYSSFAGAYGDMYIGRNSGDAIVVKANSNVLIGPATDNGSKLQVNSGNYGGVLELTSTTSYAGMGLTQGNGYRWFMGSDNTQEFYIWYNGAHRFDLNATGNLKLGGSLSINAGDYIANRATLVLNSNSGSAADIIFKANSTTKGNYGWWAISSRNDSTGRFSIFRGNENGANKSEAEIFTIRANGQTEVNGNISASGYQLPTSAPSNPASGGYYLYVGTLGAGATIS